MVKELLIGAGIALVIFLASQGVDITPFLALAGVACVFRLMMDGKGGMSKRFEVLGGSLPPPVTTTVTFADIGGQEVAKKEFIEALDLMREPEKAARLGVRPLKGLLLAGPPGTGKTLLAKAAANYTDSAFVAASGSQFVEMYAGVGAQRIRKIFRDAQSLAERQGKRSAIIFIDEIEVLGGKRGKHSSHLEYDQTLNELLVQMDGINTGKSGCHVLVVAATNRPDLLDAALLRPGRFDRTVRVDLPDKDGRLHILRIHTKDRPLAADVDLEVIARETYGLSGAHLEAVVNEAAILAMRADKQQIEMEHLREALDKVLMGEKLDRRPTNDERERIAYHEVGHALISEMVRPGSVSTVTVTPRGMAMGYMRQMPEDDRYLYTKQDLLDQIAVCLGGAVAEQVCLGSRSTGATGDYEQALNLTHKLIAAGLSDLGVVDPEGISTQLMHEETQKIIRAQEEYVQRQIEVCRDRIQEAAWQLQVAEKLSGDEFRRIVGQTTPLTPGMAEAVHAAVSGLPM